MPPQGLRKDQWGPVDAFKRGGSEPGPSLPQPSSACLSSSFPESQEPWTLMLPQYGTQTSHPLSPSVSFLICKMGTRTVHSPCQDSRKVSQGPVCEAPRDQHPGRPGTGKLHS